MDIGQDVRRLGRITGKWLAVSGIWYLSPQIFSGIYKLWGHAAPVGEHVDPISLSLASLLYLLLVPTKERKGEQIVSRKVLNQLDAEKYSFTSPSFKTFYEVWNGENSI